MIGVHKIGCVLEGFVNKRQEIRSYLSRPLLRIARGEKPRGFLLLGGARVKGQEIDMGDNLSRLVGLTV